MDSKIKKRTALCLGVGTKTNRIPHMLAKDRESKKAYPTKKSKMQAKSKNESFNNQSLVFLIKLTHSIYPRLQLERNKNPKSMQ